ncbi:hypothetical protein SCB71_21270 (plasmid) [Herbiconiux sp. KACC 21604]|uniref:hypothetical protein n=1 Tax=unclassified Herbiconiux TaxID=2618217 RepID=UPI00149301D9|nr:MULTISPECIES: hypothetical protein [unclassified Herbiconiux]QJU56276.1 hypothetical protein HL652_21065 [Herbiconiux sp. SALV-R1]WPO88781.1 hypothetical protein SCB71_21270 [Herbiconiux sp. KACC 21604]
MLYIARGIEDDHYWVVEEFDGGLVETPWRIEREFDGYRLSHADDQDATHEVYALGSFSAPETAVEALLHHFGGIN